MRSDRISSTKTEISKQFPVEKPANTGKAKLQTVQIIKISGLCFIGYTPLPECDLLS